MTDHDHAWREIPILGTASRRTSTGKRRFRCTEPDCGAWGYQDVRPAGEIKPHSAKASLVWATRYAELTGRGETYWHDDRGEHR